MSIIKAVCSIAITGLLSISCLTMEPAFAGNTNTATEPAPNASPEAIVDAQLAAYNRRDLEGFLDFYAEHAILANHPDQVTQTGKAEIRARYRQRFSHPDVHAEIIERVTFGRFVIDHERVVAAPPAKGTLEAVAVYEVSAGKIVRVTFLKN